MTHKNARVSFLYVKTIVYSFLESVKLTMSKRMVCSFRFLFECSVIFWEYEGFSFSQHVRNLYNFLNCYPIVLCMYKFNWDNFLIYVGEPSPYWRHHSSTLLRWRFLMDIKFNFEYLYFLTWILDSLTIIGQKQDDGLVCLNT